MGFFIQDAMAQAAPGQQGSLMSFLLPLVIFIGVFYFLLIRPQQKRAKDHKTMIGSISAGDEVVTGGGILGKVIAIGDQFITLEVAANTQVKVQRHTIGQVMPKGTVKSV